MWENEVSFSIFRECLKITLFKTKPNKNPMGGLNCINLAVIETRFLLVVFILSNCIWLLFLWPSSSFYLIKERHAQIRFFVSFIFIFFIKSLIINNFKIFGERKLSLVSVCDPPNVRHRILSNVWAPMYRMVQISQMCCRWFS